MEGNGSDKDTSCVKTNATLAKDQFNDLNVMKGEEDEESIIDLIGSGLDILDPQLKLSRVCVDAQSSELIQEPRENLPDIPLRRFKKFFCWRVMGGLVMACGTTAMKVEHYEYLRHWMSWSKEDQGNKRGTSSYSHLQKNIFPFMRKFSFPKTITCSFDVNAAKSGTAAGTKDSEQRLVPVRKQLKVVLLSEWIRRDLSSGRRFMQLCTEGAKVEPNQFIFDSVENCPIIRNRGAYTTSSTVFFSRNPVEDSDLCRSIPEGTAVHFSITFPSDENGVDEFKTVFTDSGLSESEFSQSTESNFGDGTCFRGCVQNTQLQNDNSRSDIGFIHGDVLVDIAIGTSQAGYNFTLANRILLMDADEY